MRLVLESSRTGGAGLSDTVIAIVLFDMAVKYLLLVGAVKLYGGRCAHLRMLGATLISAIHSGVAAIGLISSMDPYAARMSVLCVTGIIAFGWKKGGIWKTTVFLFLNAAFEGTLKGRQLISGMQQLAAAGTIVILCYILRRSGRAVKPIADIEIVHDGKLVCVEAMRDTGNDLTDILTGLPVVVVGPDVAFQLTGLTREELAAPLETMERRPVKGLRLIPFSSVGNSNGLMLGVRFRDICVDGVPADLVIGMAADGMGRYEALIGGEYAGMDHQMGERKMQILKGDRILHRWIRCASVTAKGSGGAGRSGSLGEGR